VDPSTPHYLDIIARPMDLGTVAEKLHAGKYSGAPAFVQDVRLVFSNCCAYNEPGSPLFKLAQDLAQRFERFNSQHLKEFGPPTGVKQPQAKRAKTSSEPEPGVTAPPEVEVEVPMTINEILGQLKIQTDARRFEIPRGWQFDTSQGYAPRDLAASDVPRFGKDRDQLELFLEEQRPAAVGASADAGPTSPAPPEGPWLGQVIHGEWQLREQFVVPALRYILRGLELSGHVEVLKAEGPGGRVRETFIAANRYTVCAAPEKDKTRPREPRAKKSAWDTGNEELSEFEKHRKSNMERNQAFLESLGLG